MKVIGVTWVEQGMRVALPWQRGAPECSPPAVPPGKYSLKEVAGNAVQVLVDGVVALKLVGVVGVIHYGPDDADDSGAGSTPPKKPKPQLP